MIQTLGLAIAFSPTAEMILAEAVYLARQFNAKLILIHAGPHGQNEEQFMQRLCQSRQLDPASIRIRWEDGNAVKAILQVCEEENVDLLIAGALKREKLIQYYIGTIARQIMRKATCSVLILTHPSLKPRGFKNIVIEGIDSKYFRQFIDLAVRLGDRDPSHPFWLHVVREVKMYGLAMSSYDQASEDEHERMRQDLVREEINKVEQQLRFLPRSQVKVNIKILSGKSGFELVQFARKKNADLLVVSAPERRFGLLDRIFTHDVEYVFADLPGNLLIIHPGKEESHA
ncbi:MAG: universal stress protein [Bacteroidetes bacterium]|nr:universal stress protein [Bacteroidota bacterium]